MKQLFLLAITCILLTHISRAATVSGTVTNAGTSTAVPGLKIYVRDTLFPFIDSAVTNASGFYTVTIPASHPATFLRISTTACGVLQTQTRFYDSINNITVNFSVCPGNFILKGIVSLGVPANNGLAVVQLIRKQYDSVLKDTTLTVVDSIITAAGGGVFSKSYASIPSGVLLLKAALLASHPEYANYLPTYYGASLIWNNALRLSASNFDSAVTNVITMTKRSNPGGPGTIGGSVLVGANKSAAVGDPLANRILILTNSVGSPVAYTFSATNGAFGFSNLAYGTYKLYGDAWGKTNPALTVTITSFRPGINNILFEENNKTFKGTVVYLGLHAGSALDGLGVYPNPASDFLKISGLSAIPGDKVVKLCSITGATVAFLQVGPGEDPLILTNALPSGMYTLHVHCVEGSASFKIVK